MKLIEKLGIDSLRAEITMFESARAHAIADGRDKASSKDVRIVAPMSVWLRRSRFMLDYFEDQASDKEELDNIMASLSRRKQGSGSSQRRKSQR